MTSPAAFKLLGFFATPPHECSYLPERQAVTIFADPDFPKDRRLYTLLSEHGFRRSGRHIYRPRCPGCKACVPVRVPVAEFRPRRSQRRNWRDNRDLRVQAREPVYRREHFALYQTYLDARHPGGGMDNPTPGQYLEFLTSTWSETVFYELRLGPRLAGVAVVDRLDDGLSAVYTFFDPGLRGRGLGTYAVLWEIEQARHEGLRWLYLGYWIEASPKMRYKTDYQPLEYFHQGSWQRTPP